MMFISFEGLDGSGKTTQIELFAAYLRAEGYDVVVTREPGGTAIGDQIRDVLHSLKNEAMHPRTELLLYNASRAQLVEEYIRPKLEAGTIVICDRFADSTLAYQGYGHGLDLDMLQMILDFTTGGLKPDCTIYLDISAEAGLKRREEAAAAGEEWTRMDAQTLAFHRRVGNGYRQLIAQDQDRWLVIDALGSEKEIQHRIMKAFLPRLKQFR